MEVLIGALCLLVSLALSLAVMFFIVRGIWRALFKSNTPGNKAHRCQRCGVAMQGVSCTTCGWQAPVTAHSPAAALHALRTQLERMRREGMLPADSCERLLALIAAEEASLASTVPSMAPTIAATTTPVTTSEEAIVLAEAIVEQVPPAEPAMAPAAPQFVPAAVPASPSAPTYAVTAEPVTASDSPPATPFAPTSQTAAAPTPPRRGMSDLLSAFMEEKNVRWGELVGGLLIVGGSVALVISFWSQIAARPLLKFGLFNGVSATLFALGFYTARKWKLPTTSRGVLAIATLLVPLNFLSIAAFTQGALASDPKVIVGELISLAIFSVLVYLAGRSIVTPAPLAMTAGVIGASISSLLIRRWIGPAAAEQVLYALAALPLACHTGAVATIIARTRRSAELDEPAINALLRMLGVTAFAAMPPCGLLLALSGSIPETMQRLAPLVTIAGAPTMAVGLLLWRRVQNADFAGLRTAGTALAVLGSLIMLGGVVLAWPEPGLLVAVAGLCFVVLTSLAIAVDIAPAHLLAGVALSLGYLVLVHIVRGDLPWRDVTTEQTSAALLSATSGNALTLLAVLYGIGAALWQRLRRPLDARFYVIIAGAAATVGLALVTLYGFRVVGDPHHATWIYTLYAVAALVAAVAPLPTKTSGQGDIARVRKITAYAGAMLLALALVQGIVYLPGEASRFVAPWTTATALHALVVSLLAAIASFRRGKAESKTIDAQSFAARDALVHASLAASALGALFLAADLFTESPLSCAIHLSMLSIAWLIAALARRSTALFDLFQASLYFVATLGTAEFVSHQTWYASTNEPWINPRMLQWQGAVWAVLSLLWLALRVVFGRRTESAPPTLRHFLVRTSNVSVDYLATGMLVIGLLGLTTYAALPGVLQELSTEQSVRALATNHLHAMTIDGVTRTVPAAVAFELPGIPHLPARQLGTWLLLGLVAALLVAGLWEKLTLVRLIGLIVLGAAICPLLAASFESDLATASALRWLLAGSFLVISLAIWGRDRLALIGTRLGLAGGQQLQTDSRQIANAVLELLTVTPVVLISLFVAGAQLLRDPVLGPSSATLFGRTGLAANLALPVALVALTLVGHALRERSAGCAFAAGLVTNLCASLAWLFTAGPPLALDDIELWVQLAQLNAAVSSTFGLAWLGAIWWRARRHEGQYAIAPLHVMQAALGVLLNLLVLLPATLAIFDEPSPVPGWLSLGATPLGVTAAALAFLFALLLAEQRAPVASISLVAVGLWTAATLAALFATGHDTGDWLAFHTLIVGRVLTPALLVTAAWLWYRGTALEFRDRRRQAVTLWAVLLIPIVVMLAFRGYDDDPLGLWWSSLPVKATACVAILVTLWSYRRRYLFLASMLYVLTTSLWYTHDGNVWRPAGDGELLGFLYFNILALAAPVVVWLLIELRWMRPKRAFEPNQTSLPVHRPATWLAIASLALLSTVLLLADFYGEHFASLTLLASSTIAIVGVAALACLWDNRAREAVFALYVYGLVLVGNYLDALNLAGDTLIWRGAIALGAFNLATSYLWSRREGMRQLATRLRMPARPAGETDGLVWLVPFTLLMIGIVLTLVFATELNSADRMLRVTAAQAALAQAIALGMLSRGSQRHHLRMASLAVGTLGMIALGWSWVEPTVEAPILARSVATCVALVATAIVYSLAFNRLPQRAAQWIEAARRFVPALVVALVASITVVLLQEVILFAADEPVPLAWHGILAVALALGALFAASLGAALLPGRDPLSLSERGRMVYVYAAEVVLALLFLHIRVTMPWLFNGRFQQFWPLIVMAIAFLGVGLGELFGRRQQKILAEPLERTGILLPLLPVLGFWFFPSGTNYSVVLLVVGGLYATLAVTRKSFGFGLLAALAANGGLWHYLHQIGGVGLLEHPQLWMIPPALCVLAAAYLNRDRLSTAQMTSIRYITSMTIYLSSTADIFLNGVAQAPWLPLVLAALSLGGIFAGILLRVRAFLFLGTGFLILSIVTIIYHAAVNLHQTWIWAASITATGIAIIVLFAIFEKKRQDVLRVVDSLRHWQA